MKDGKRPRCPISITLDEETMNWVDEKSREWNIRPATLVARLVELQIERMGRSKGGFGDPGK